MNSLKEHLTTQLNEARGIEYNVALNDVKDNDGMPVTVAIVCSRQYQKQFEEWLNSEECNTFAHAEGGNVEY